MIQAVNIKNIDPKLAQKAKGASVSGEAQVVDPETMLEGGDFVNELMASLNAEEADLKVKPVQVSPENMMESPSGLIKLPEAGPDAINPKVFDPALTNGVDNIIQPKTTATPLTNEQVLKLAQGQNPAQVQAMTDVQAMTEVQALPTEEVPAEIAQAMLKTPQVQTGRAPALDMAKAEIDPQLLNMEDFVAQKNLAVKKSLNNSTGAYGMPAKGQANKSALESGLKTTQTVNAAESGAGSTGSSLNAQQFILNAQADMGSSAKVNETHAPVKTFDMSHIKTENSNQIMNQITNYIVQAKAAKEPTVNMRVNHEELGIIDITVNRSVNSADAIAINIGTHSVDGKNFFQANSKDLFAHLTNSGLNVSDLKVETPSQTAKNDFDFGSQSGKGSSGQEKHFGSEQNQRRHESERRQELWNLLKDKEAA